MIWRKTQLQKCLCLLLSVSMVIPVTASAQQAQTEARVPDFWEFVTDLPQDLRDFGIEVLKPENRGLVAGVLGMTAMTVKTDFESWRAVSVAESQSPKFRQFSNLGVSMGDGFFQFGIAGVFLAGGLAFKNKTALRTTSQIVEAILATGIIVQVVKHISGRESPFSSESRTGVWRLFPDQFEYNKDFQKYDAVPSGHLSTATATYIVIYENYPDQKWIPYVGLPILAWVSTGLVATSIHWWSDFPIALALGYSMGRIITRENRGELPTRSAWEPRTILPAFSARGEPMVLAGWEF